LVGNQASCAPHEQGGGSTTVASDQHKST
jgi:hypothetical protein